jgi:hypothetical protein
MFSPSVSGHLEWADPFHPADRNWPASVPGLLDQGCTATGCTALSHILPARAPQFILAILPQ